MSETQGSLPQQLIRDIRAREFKKRLRGYDLDEVDMFLDALAEQIQALGVEQASLQDRLQRATDQINHYKSMEETLRETLVSAQKNADELHENAKRRAELIIARAEEQARVIRTRASEELVDAQSRATTIKQRADMYRSRFLMLMEAQHVLLENSDLYETVNAQGLPTLAGELMAEEPAIAAQAAALESAPESEQRVDSATLATTNVQGAPLMGAAPAPAAPLPSANPSLMTGTLPTAGALWPEPIAAKEPAPPTVVKAPDIEAVTEEGDALREIFRDEDSSLPMG